MTRNSRLKAFKFLVVDDEPLVLKLTLKILGQLGAEEIVTASNGEDALDKLDSADFKPDILLVDLDMPVMGGVEFLRELAEREYPGLSSWPVRLMRKAW
jgi:CheY-like chemotaxis protein